MQLRKNPEGAHTVFDSQPLRSRPYADSVMLTQAFVEKHSFLKNEDRKVAREQLLLAYLQGMPESLIEEIFSDEGNRSTALDILRSVYYITDEETVRELLGRQFTLAELRLFLHEKFLSEELSRLPAIHELLEKRQELEKRYDANLYVLENEQRLLREEKQAFEEERRLLWEERALRERRQGLKCFFDRAAHRRKKERRRQDEQASLEKEERTRIIHAVAADRSYSAEQVQLILDNEKDLTVEELRLFCNPDIGEEKMRMFAAYWKRRGEAHTDKAEQKGDEHDRSGADH